MMWRWDGRGVWCWDVFWEGKLVGLVFGYSVMRVCWVGNV